MAEPFSTSRPGEIIAEQGVTAAGVLLLLDGVAQALIVDGRPGRARRPPPRADVDGRDRACSPAARSASGCGPRATAEIACIEPEDFRRLAFAHPAVHERVMRQVAPVMSRVTAIEQNRERLAALGKMAAGLAHELNNPAAAAQRAAAQMAEALEVVSGDDRALRRVRASSATQAAELVALQREAVAQAPRATAVDALDAADAEDELPTRLEDLGVAEPWRLRRAARRRRASTSEWLDRVAGARRVRRPTPRCAWVAATLDRPRPRDRAPGVDARGCPTSSAR